MSSIVGTSRRAIEGQPSADGLDPRRESLRPRTAQLGPGPQRVAARQPRPRRSGEKRGREQCVDENEGEGRGKEEASVAKRPRRVQEKGNSPTDVSRPPDLADGDEGGDAGPDAGVSSSEEGVQLEGAAVVHAGPPGQRGESIGEQASPKRGGNGRRGTRSAAAEQRRTEEKRKKRKSSKRPKQKNRKSAAASPPSPPATVPEGSGRESWATEKFHAPPGWRGKRFNPTEQKLHRGQLQFRKEVAHIKDKDGNPIPWNCLRLSWKTDRKNNKVIVLVLHYQTLETALALGDQHSAAALRSDGTLRECTWESTRQGVGPEHYGDMNQCDVYPFPFKAYTSPYSYLSRKDVAFVMESWKRNVLSVLHEDDNVQIALCSKATGTLWAHYLLGGDDADLATFHAQNPGKLVSASVDELKLPCHPSSMYKKLFQSCMETKCGDTDEFYSAVKVAKTGDASAKCTYFMGIFDEDSDFYRLADLAHREGCQLGGETTGKMRTEAATLRREKRYGEMTGMHWFLLEVSSRGGTTAMAAEGDYEDGRKVKAVRMGVECQRRNREAQEAVDRDDADDDQRKRAREWKEYTSRGGTNSQGSSLGGTSVWQNNAIVQNVVFFFVWGNGRECDVPALSAPDLGQIMLEHDCPLSKVHNQGLHQRIRDGVAKEKGVIAIREAIAAKERGEDADSKLIERMEAGDVALMPAAFHRARKVSEARESKKERAKERNAECSAKTYVKIKGNREEVSQSRNEEEEKYFRETGYCYLLARYKKLPDGWGANTTFKKFMHPDGRTIYRGLKAAKTAAMEPSYIPS